MLGGGVGEGGGGVGEGCWEEVLGRGVGRRCWEVLGQCLKLINTCDRRLLVIKAAKVGHLHGLDVGIWTSWLHCDANNRDKALVVCKMTAFEVLLCWSLVLKSSHFERVLNR